MSGLTRVSSAWGQEDYAHVCPPFMRRTLPPRLYSLSAIRFCFRIQRRECARDRVARGCVCACCDGDNGCLCVVVFLNGI